MPENILSIQNLTKSFGNTKALNRCSLDIPPGIIAGLIGPNGAGKSTLVNVITGLLEPDEGEMYFKGNDIFKLAPHKTAQLGIGRTFQISRALLKMKVLDNLKLAAPSQAGESLNNVFFRPGKVKKQEEIITDRAVEILKNLNLYELKDNYSDTLSGGQKKLLEIGRAIMLESDFIIMDEPLAGVNPALGDELYEHFKKLNEQGLTLLIIEHNVKNLMEISDIVYVMNKGEIIAYGPPETIQQNEKVIESYLGSEEE